MEALFRRLMNLIGRPDLVVDARFAGDTKRVANVRELDSIIAEWTRGRAVEEADRFCRQAGIPSTLVYAAREYTQSDQFRAGHMVREVDDPIIGKTLHPGVVPRLGGCESRIKWTGLAIGAHTDEALPELAGIEPGKVEA